jgi:hypothetical protein
MNYSHYLLSKRKVLVQYFTNVRANIHKGLFVIDFFGVHISMSNIKINQIIMNLEMKI